ncbi:MAG: sugar ABC transporter ATP-binding protein, partial [Clostridiales bacterium]|nr:sugar ABC transporter ATP-binding protein [Clostridiales bacterium]
MIYVNYVLEAIEITKRFPGVLANDKICLNVKAGEVLGLIGENGAGKSTLLKVLNGIYPHGTYTGTLKLNGEEIKPTSPNDAMRLGIGYVPQEINVLKYFSVAENIYMSDLHLERVKGQKSNSPFVDFKTMYEATEKLLKDNHISLNPRADVRKLSIGQQQMLMIARALATNPKVLILDEPTTSLSSEDVEQLFKVVRKLKEKGTSIIFVTHKLAEILELTDRVTILRDGKNISTFEKAEYDTAKIIHDMIGRDLQNMYPPRNVKIGDEVLRVENLTVAHP